ncbi:PIN domain-like protein [Piptocephalis cylindrospora]|uniref:Flap endonuclease 1 n=1 Tax=Piptocephalis cylindrospora TaxID=1907219 RepID=A0A4P9Y7A8_9FUNG|nr:PIN domain-like protein [Piptocephalis cylindrospora]|eukprot:RKP13760.1 PIN domain-like protein [Piptocephalis cylindrospora]
MGISGLAKVIADNAPHAIHKQEIKSYFGRKVAIDASMSIYQFLIAVRSEGQMLQNEEGETTSHLMGIFYRTIRMVEYGIKPLYVFDGKPPQLKSGELAKRLEKRQIAIKGMTEAKEAGDQESFDKHSRRMVKVTAQHNQECKRLLTLMGIPFLNAPCEAEAQCAELCRAGKVFASASEDMDTLTFNSSILLRHLTFSEARKMPIDEIHLKKALEGLDLTMDQFIDLCILLGCDYCDSIRGIGPHRALALIRQHKTIETVLENLDQSKYPVPEDWPYKASRELFKNPDVLSGDTVDLKWNEPDVEGVIQMMVKENGFSEQRIRAGVEKLTKGLKVAPQGRLDGFFKVTSSPSSKDASGKRKSMEGPAGTKGKKGRVAPAKSKGYKPRR